RWITAAPTCVQTISPCASCRSWTASRDKRTRSSPPPAGEGWGAGTALAINGVPIPAFPITRGKELNARGVLFLGGRGLQRHRQLFQLRDRRLKGVVELTLLRHQVLDRR